MAYRIRIPSEIVIGRRTAAIAAAGLLSVGLAVLVSSETITLETFYPSPAGVYKNLTTLSATVLARDGGEVSVGTLQNTASLDVKGVVVPGRFPADPMGPAQTIEGGIYFNTATKKHRAFSGGTWADMGADGRFGGFFSRCNSGCNLCTVANPLTGAANCPPGFTTTVIQTINGSNPCVTEPDQFFLSLCWK